MSRSRWNHNIHYHPLIIGAVPVGGRVLDVGCGEGMLTRELALRASAVVGVDTDAPSIELARATTTAPNIEYVHADVLTYPLEREGFDAVVSVATLHHIGTEVGLRRMAQLLRPGGVLAVIGLASSELPRDLPWEIAAAVSTRVLRLRHAYWEHSAPKVWRAPDSYRVVQRIAAACLPQSDFRRRLLWRFSLRWRKPGG